METTTTVNVYNTLHAFNVCTGMNQNPLHAEKKLSVAQSSGSKHKLGHKNDITKNE